MQAYKGTPHVDNRFISKDSANAQCYNLKYQDCGCPIEYPCTGAHPELKRDKDGKIIWKDDDLKYDTKVEQRTIRDFVFAKFPANSKTTSMKILFKEGGATIIKIDKNRLAQLKAILNIGFPEL